jgi:hypothetical protein
MKTKLGSKLLNSLRITTHLLERLQHVIVGFDFESYIDQGEIAKGR